MDAAYEVIDVHHHVGSAFLALGGSTQDPAKAGTVDAAEAHARTELASRLEIMQTGGVHQAVVIPGHGYLRPHGIKDTRAENDAIARYRDQTPERFPAAVGVVEPRDGPASLDEVFRSVVGEAAS